MSRPAVSVVVPFGGGDPAGALALLATVSGAGDQLILADNAGTVSSAPDPIDVVRAAGERTPGHARNAGATRATRDWILFLDADVVAPADLLARYFDQPVDERVGALAGEIVPASGGPDTLANRYATAKNFLSAQAHLAHPFRPRAAAANLLVRRAAFEAAAGFAEGVRAAEDTDFCWRLQDLGWTLGLRAEAVVEHQYRTSIRELRAQWRAYAAGRAWLARRYPAFTPEPALKRALTRSHVPVTRSHVPVTRSRRERYEFLVLDLLLAVEELIGLKMSNEL